MAIKKVKLTSQTTWETEKDLNDNFSEIETRLDEVPTKTSDLTNDGDGTSNFATESYVDTNGGKIDSISVNNTPQTIDANKNVNITVPVTAADVSALPASTKYGASLSLTMNSSTFVITLQLKDQDGNNLGTAQTVDLPLESVVVSGSYDAVNKKVILTLKDGSTVEFSVADLISGLQSEITSNNKLASDLVDDTNQTHKFVSAADKAKWDAKQDAIQDFSFTDADAGWGALDANGFYTLTISNTAGKKPFIVYNTSGAEVCATKKYDATHIYIITDTKFSGVVSAR